MSKIKVTVAYFVAALFMGTLAAQSVPKLISYQGQLNNQSGAPVTGSVSFVFSIYGVATGGTALWTENQPIQVSNGVFNVQLGAITPLPSTLFNTEPLYLGIKAGADAEMLPRQRLTSSAYSFKAELAGPPVGSIIAWNKSMPGTPPLSFGWVECNGQVLADPNSPYNGQAIPDLNGNSSSGRFLRGATASGSTAGTDTHVHKWAKGYGTPLGITTTGSSAHNQTYESDGVNWHYMAQNVDHYTDMQSNLPSYYSVVWIMRVK